MNVIFLGVQSCGKGTQAEFVSKKRKVVHFSMGEVLRKKADDPYDPLGLTIKERINKGLLVDDELIMQLIEDFVNNLSNDEGILFDGFPRSIEQAKLLDKLFIKCGREIDYVINFELDDRVVLERISGRRSCPECGKNYHIKFNPPKIENTCDVCDSKLVMREDDKDEDSIRNRISTYYAITYPLIDYYKEQGKLVSIDALQDIEDIAKDIDDILGGKYDY